MEYTETEIEGVWVIQPKVFDDARGYFSRLGNRLSSMPTLVIMLSLCKTMSLCRVEACFEAFIIRREKVRRLNWCVSSRVRSWMLR